MKFTFPSVLAGPILRRVEPTQIFIWIATSKSLLIQTDLYKLNKNNNELTKTKCDTNSIRLGENLYIHLIKVTPMNEPFLMNQLYGYNLHFRQGSDTFHLGDLGYLTPHKPESIVYGNLNYPSFFISHPKNSSNLLYGSCRKLHGEGEDSLAHADQHVKVNHLDVTSRPEALFLMGDQIYADDVPDPLIRPITKFSKRLIGKKEKLEQIEERLDNPFYKNSLSKINGRKFIMENFCQFTSSKSQNHLMEFGEYAAMYLLSWSPVLWELAQEYDIFESFEDAFKNDHLHLLFDEKNSMNYRIEKNKLQIRYNERQDILTSFQPSVYRVRRLLANTPTYMIFDDHDITDDWNITANWKKNVEQSPLGKHVICNGLSAYWAFQGWGNNPDEFNSNFLSTMKNYFTSLSVGKMHMQLNQRNDLLYQFDRWHFIAPTTPKAVFLDTRTQREFDVKPKAVKNGGLMKETTLPPQLVNAKEWKQIERQLNQVGWKKNTPLIIVSPTPLYGMGLIESFLHDYVYPLNLLGVEATTTFDFEAWKYNGEGFTNFLRNVANWNPNECIILSGDVHYSSAVYSKVTFPNGKKVKIKQFTSSPIKNMSFQKVWGNLLRLVLEINGQKRKEKTLYRSCNHSYRIQHVEKEEFAKEESYLWKDKLKYQPTENNSILETKNNIGLLSLSSKSIENSFLKK